MFCVNYIISGLFDRASDGALSVRTKRAYLKTLNTLNTLNFSTPEKVAIYAGFRVRLVRKVGSFVRKVGSFVRKVGSFSS